MEGSGQRFVAIPVGPEFAGHKGPGVILRRVVATYRAAAPTDSGAPDAGPSARMPRNTGMEHWRRTPTWEVNPESRLPAVHCSPEAEGGELHSPASLTLAVSERDPEDPDIDGRCGEAVPALVGLLRIDWALGGLVILPDAVPSSFLLYLYGGSTPDPS